VGPKPIPLIVTGDTGPIFGETAEITGVGITTKYAAVPVTPEAVTVTFPLLAPGGTVTTICVEVQVVIAAVTPSKATVLEG